MPKLQPPAYLRPESTASVHLAGNAPAAPSDTDDTIPDPVAVRLEK
jgi:hypothetical protein